MSAPFGSVFKIYACIFNVVITLQLHCVEPFFIKLSLQWINIELISCSWQFVLQVFQVVEWEPWNQHKQTINLNYKVFNSVLDGHLFSILVVFLKAANISQLIDLWSTENQLINGFSHFSGQNDTFLGFQLHECQDFTACWWIIPFPIKHLLVLDCWIR